MSYWAGFTRYFSEANADAALRARSPSKELSYNVRKCLCCCDLNRPLAFIFARQSLTVRVTSLRRAPTAFEFCNSGTGRCVQSTENGPLKETEGRAVREPSINSLTSVLVFRVQFRVFTGRTRT